MSFGKAAFIFALYKKLGARSYYIERDMAINNTEYDLVIATSEGFRDAIREVARFDDRLMKLTIISTDRTIHFFTAYAPKTVRSDTEKDAF